MRIKCPICNEPAFIRTSKRPSPVFYETYVECRSEQCGWYGKAYVEFVATLWPSRMEAAPSNIPLDSAARERLLEQLAEQ